MAIEFVSGYFPLYLISDNGEVHSAYTRKNLKPFLRNGYESVCLIKNGKKSFKTVHRLIAETFIENDENKSQVNHKDGNKRNNSIDNIEWATPSENITHAHRTGLIPKLVHTQEYKDYMSILTKERLSKRVLCIDTGKRYASGKVAALELGITHSSVCRVCAGTRNTAGGMRFKYYD